MAAAFIRNLLLAMAQQYYDDEGRSLKRCLRLYAGAYMLPGASFLLPAALPPAAADSAANVSATFVLGFLLWMAALALLLLSFMHRRFPEAAVATPRLAQAALEPLFELLN